MLTKTLTIKNQLGLHARASAKFVSTASKYTSKITVTKDEKTVNGKSIMGMMMLAASKGSDILLTLEGKDAEEMLTALETLVNDYFGEGQ